MFDHIHASGRFTASTKEEEAAVDSYMRQSDLLTVTEVDAAARSKCLAEPGWNPVFGNKGGRDDCGLSVRKSVFVVQDEGTSTLSPLRYRTERGKLADTTEAAFAVIREKTTAKVGVVIVVHMPHGMQDELRTNHIRSDVAKAYRDMVKGIRKLANRLNKKHNANWTMIVGDWNLNIKSAWVGPYFRVNFPGYSVNFHKPYPSWGSFGKTLIDLALLRGIKVKKGPNVLPHKAGFDHVGWKQTLG